MSANNGTPLISLAVACGGVMATSPGRPGLVLMSEHDLERFRDRLALQSAPPPTRATGEKVSENAQRFCTARVDHPSTFTLGWRAAEAFHGIKEQP